MWKFAEAYSVEVTEAKIAVYTELLADLSPQALDACCRAAVKSCRFFPTPADIREQLKTTQGDALTLEAERAWEALLGDFAEWYFCRVDGHGVRTEVGVKSRGGKFIPAPPLPLATEYALRQVGGYAYVGSCDPDHVRWIRKDFIEAYIRYNQTGGLKQLPSLSEMPKAIAETLRPLIRSKEM